MGTFTRARTIGVALTGMLVASMIALAAPTVSYAATPTAQSASATAGIVIAAAPHKLKTSTPTISGTRQVTKTLTAKTGTWTKGTTFTYKWYANGKTISKATKKTLKLSATLAGKKISVKVTGKKSGYKTVSKTSKKTATIGYPSRTKPVSAWNCPSWAPIKGNANSMIYHMPHQRYYKVTKPEDCFRTQAAAKKAHYRKAKV